MFFLRPLYVTISYWYFYVFRSIRDHNHQGWWSLQSFVLQKALTPYGEWSACHRTLRSVSKFTAHCQEFSEISGSVTSDNFLTSWATISFAERRWSAELVIFLVQIMRFNIPSVSANKWDFFPVIKKEYQSRTRLIPVHVFCVTSKGANWCFFLGLLIETHADEIVSAYFATFIFTAKFSPFCFLF